MEQYGYVGNILRVNLTTGEHTIFPTETYVEGFLGSKGLAAKIYWEEIGPEVQPFDPENKLIFTSGPLNGTGANSSGKGSLAGKSPVWYPVHSFTHSTTGNFSPSMKRAGFDAIIIEGKAEHPVYLWICDRHVEIRDGRDLWGKTTRNTREMLRERHGHNVVVACIGPAGENQVVSSVVSVASNQVFGRGGFGAVFGSKNLKAVVVTGKGRIKVANPEGLLALNRERAVTEAIKIDEHRTVMGQEVIGAPWEETAACNYGSVGAETQLREMARYGRVRIKPNACESCFVFCRTKYNWHDKSQQDSSVICASNIGFATGEAIHNKFQKKMLGLTSYKYAQVLDDLGLNMNDFSQLAPLYGVPGKFDETEHIEGSLQGGDWLYQAHLFGILTNENTGWKWENFGTDEFIEQMLLDVSYRRGFGNIMAQGFRYATQYIYEHEEFGENRKDIMFIYHRIYAKAGNMGCLENGHGQYVPNPGRSIYTALGDRTGSEPEFMWSRMVKYPSGTPDAVREKWLGEGANKILDLHYWGPEVAHAVIMHENYCSTMDSMHICSVGTLNNGSYGLAAYTNRSVKFPCDPYFFMYHTPNGASEFLTQVFGHEVSYEECVETGERITNLIRAIWVRDGYTSVVDPFWGGDYDTLWDMQFERKDPDGVLFTDPEGFKATRADYYKERGWIDGVPTRETLERLNLKYVADDLEARGLLKG